MKRFVRMLGIFLLLTLLVAAMGIVANAESFPEAAGATPLQLDTPQYVTISGGKNVYLSFTPAESGAYILKSQAEEGDPYGYVYDAAGNQLAYNDDSDGLNFQLECQMEAGKTYFYGVSAYGEACTYSVVLRGSAIASIDINPIYVIEGQDGYESDSWDEETGEYLPYFYYQWYNYVNGTVTFKDGTTAPITNRYFTYQGEDYYLGYWDEQFPQDPWTVGNTYTATVSAMGYSAPVSITVVTTPIADIQFDPIVLFKEQSGWNYSDYDEETGEWNRYFFYDWDNYINGTVTFVDGSTATIEDGHFTYQGTTQWVSYEEKQSYENQWTIGTYTQELNTLNYTAEVEVTIEYSLVTNVQLDPITVIEEYDGCWQDRWDEEAGEWVRTYFYYEWYNYVTGTVTFKDGTTAPIVDRHFTYQDETYGLTFHYDQSEENPWTVGNTYAVEVSAEGCYGQTSVSVITTPIEEIQIDPIVMYQGVDDGWSSSWNEETSQWEEFNHYYWEDRVTGKVIFKDGSSTPIAHGGFTYRGQEYWLEYQDDQTYDNQWTVGTYTVEATALNYTEQISVTVEATPIADIQLEPVVMYQELDNEWRSADDENGEWLGSYNYYNWRDRINGTVTFKDGSTTSINNGWFTYRNNEYLLEAQDDQYLDNEWTAGAYTPEFTALNYTGYASVIIEATPVASIQLDPITLIKEENGWWQSEYDEDDNWLGNWFHYDWYYNEKINGTVTFKDGTTAPIVNAEFYYRDCNYYVERPDQQSFENQWDVGTNTAEVVVLNYTGTVDVILEYSLVVDIQIDPIVVIEEYDGGWQDHWDEETGEWTDLYFRYDWWNYVNGTVTFKDGTTAPVVDRHFTYQGEEYWLDYPDDQSYDNRWTAGNTYIQQVSVRGCYKPVSITIITTPIADIQLDPIVMNKEENGWWTGDWNEETGESTPAYFHYEWYASEKITGTVTFVDGSTAPIVDRRFTYRDRDIWLEPQDEQSYDNQWDVGTYTPELSALNYTANANITIEYALVVDLQIDPITVVNRQDGGWDSSWNEETGETYNEYYRYYWWNHITGTVTFKDGTTAPIEDRQFIYQGEVYWLGWNDDQSYENPWTVGNTYTPELVVVGYHEQISVTVENPQAEQIVPDTNYPVQLPEGDSSIFFAFTPEEDGTYIFFSLNKGYGDPKGYLYDEDMLELAYSDDEAGNGNFMFSGKLSAGKTYYLKATKFYSAASYSIKVISVDIQAVDIAPIVMKEDVDNQHMMVGGIPIYTWWNRLSGSVTFADGTVVPVDGASISYKGMRFPISYSYQDQENDPWIAEETYEVEVEILGNTYPVSVTVEPCPIVSITPNPVVMKTENNGWWNEDWIEGVGYVEWFEYDWQSEMSYTVQLRDGTEIYGTGTHFSYDGTDYYIASEYYGGYDNRMEVGNTYTLKISVIGKEADVSITIANGIWEGGFEYLVNDGKAIIYDSVCTDEVLVIPQTLNGYPVVAVEHLGSAMLYAKEIVVGDSVTKLGNYIFGGSVARKITLGKGITGCNWENMIWAKNLEEVVISSQNPDLKSVDGVVYNKAVTKLLFVPAGKTGQHTVPNTVTDVTNLVDYIQRYESLDIVFGTGVTDYVVIDGAVYNKDVSKLYYVNKNTEGSFIMPATVTTLNEMVFEGADYSKVTVSPRVTDLVYGTFKGCRNLRSVTLPENLIGIGGSAFAECTNLQAVVIPAGVEYIYNAFIDSSVTHIFYKGTEEQWNNVEKWFYEGDYTVHCNATGNEMHLEAEGNQLKMYCSICDEWTVINKSGTPLELVRQPMDNSAYLGETVSVSVEAEGDGLTYQWYYKPSNGEEFLKSSQTTDTYTTTMTEARNGYEVYCQVMDQYGNDILTNVVTLWMRTPLELLAQPESVSVENGGAVEIGVDVSGDGLTFQWYYKSATASSYSKSSNTTPVYTTVMTDARDGYKVYCVITDQYGSSVTTQVATLTKQTPLTITKQPVGTTVANGATAKVSVTATGDGLKYQWYYRPATGGAFLKSSNTTATYSTTMNASRNGYQVYCVITDQYGKTVTTNTVTIKMQAQQTQLTITNQPVGATVANGATATVSVSATGSGLKYQWYYRPASGGAFLKSSQTTATYSTTMTAARNGYQLYCVITDQYGKTVTTNTVTIKMQASLTITNQPVGVTVANGATATVSVSATGSGLKYQWYYRPASGGAFLKSSQTTATYSTTMTAARNGYQLYCVITDQNGNTVTTNTVTIKMQTAVKITKQPTSVSVSNGATAKVSVSATGDGLKYQWYYKPVGGSFVKSSQTTAVYSTTMTAARNGYQLYCVITDQYGNTVTTNTVTISKK